MTAYCINLPDRTDKWAQVLPELNKLPINVLKWNATKMTPGYDGCRCSHLSIMEHHVFSSAKDELLMIFEDDVVFEVNDPWGEIQTPMAELPVEWDVLYLGATLNQKLDRYSEHLYKLKKAWTTHAMIFNNQNGVIDFILEHGGGGHKIDVFYAEVVQENFNCYITRPLIANQRNGWSDILNRQVQNGDYIRDFYKLHTGGNLK